GERVLLLDGYGVHEAQVDGVGHHRRHRVVTQAAGVDGVRDELAAEGVHLQQRGQAGDVAVVVAVLAPRQRRALGGLRGDDAGATTPGRTRIAGTRTSGARTGSAAVRGCGARRGRGDTTV